MLIKLETVQAVENVSTREHVWVYPGDMVAKLKSNVHPCFSIGKLMAFHREEQNAEVFLRFFFTDKEKNASMVFLKENPHLFKLVFLPDGLFILAAEDVASVVKHFSK
jgi:hypothetical protein